MTTLRRETCSYLTRIAGLLLFLLAVANGSLDGQAIRAPSFVIEPGIITTNSVSAPVASGSSTGLNLRFLAVIPTAVPWLTLQVGTSFAPFGLSNGLRAFNDPTFFYGPVVMLLPRDRAKNWLELTLPVLGAYRLDESGETDRIYVNDLVIQTAANVPVGQHLMKDMGPFWSRLTLFGIIEQNLTPSRNASTEKYDRFNPSFLYGVSIPIRGAAAPAREP
jgi:hypothetical protein